MNEFDRRYYAYYWAYLQGIDDLYSEAYAEIASAVYGARLSTDKRFTFRQSKRLSETIDGVLKRLSESTTAAIVTGTAYTWGLSNTKNDEITRSFVQDRAIPERFLRHNADKLEAFQKRKIDGLQVSSRVWHYTSDLKPQLESAIDIALREGTSAQELSRGIKKYLKDPDALFRRVRDEYGDLVPSKAMAAFHPGQGVYKSAHQNAIRLAGTSINQAYRESDLLRWQSMDFVVGYEIKPSLRRATVCPLCESLAGKYPKNFVWTGWHSRCRCYAVPILMTQDEFLSDATTSVHEVKDVPNGFKKWVGDHHDDIARSVYRDKVPYFLRDNDGRYVDLSAHKLTAAQRRIVDNRERYLTYDTKSWHRELFDKNTGGFVVVDNNRLALSRASKQEREKYAKELGMSSVFARNGHQVVMRDEHGKGNTFDVYFDGKKADLKSTSSHNNILHYTKKAVNEQGAGIVLFEFTAMTPKIQTELNRLARYGYKFHYYIKGDDKVY